MKRIFPIILALAASLAFAGDETPRAMGFRLPPFVPKVQRLEQNMKSRVLLRGAKSALPTSWDSRAKGWISPVKNQGAFFTCWAFATCAVLETQLLKAGKGEHDFSEKNMVNLSGFLAGENDGGDYGMAAAYLTRWGGAVAETNDVYVGIKGGWTSSPKLSPELRVQNIVWTPILDSSGGGMEELKSAIMDYGAVGVAISWNKGYELTNTYYNAVVKYNDHAIVAIGWDDGFPASAFHKAAPGDGAWLIKNSWGTDIGDNGYYWVSYHDVSFARFIPPAVFIPAADDEDYDVVRGYDRCGPVFDVSSDEFYNTPKLYDLQAAVFTSSWNEELAAVGVYVADYPSPYEIAIYTNVTKGAASPVTDGIHVLTQSGVLDHAGFTTIHLNSKIPLADTNSFAVVYRQTGEKRSNFVSCSASSYSNPVNYPGNCYVGYAPATGPDTWMDAYYEAGNAIPPDESWAVCIKAYTRFTKGAEKGDSPNVSDDGTAMMSDLASSEWPYLQETSDTFGPAAAFVGANGRTLWANWLWGLDAANPDSRDVELSIDMSGAAPKVDWSPKVAGRTYTLYGRDSLSVSDGWRTVSTSDLGSARFFRLGVKTP